MQMRTVTTATPQGRFTTEELLIRFPCELPDAVKKNVLSMGVETRYLIDQEPASLNSETVLSESPITDLCIQASQKAFKNTGVSTQDIGLFVMAYDVSPFLCPGLGQVVVRELGFSPYIDHVNVQGLACSAFPKSLKLAEHYLAVHPDKHVLLCISGVNSYWFMNQVKGFSGVMEIGQVNKMKNRARRLEELRKWVAAIEFFLFGDGVAVAVIGREGGGLSVGEIVDVTNLRKRNYLAGYARLTAINQPFTFGLYSHLDKEIPELGQRYVSAVLKRLLGKGLETEKGRFKKWALHTGSEKIIRLIAERNKILPEQLEESYQVLREYGNLAGASLPFILERILSQNRLRNGDRILMLGYGWGFSASAGLLEMRE